MPYIGLSSLHSEGVHTGQTPQVCVNALCRALVSAQMKKLIEILVEWMCQCPISGSRLCTFLESFTQYMWWILCQCPISGSRLCTSLKLLIAIIGIAASVNALYRAHVSARASCACACACAGGVSMPYIGLTSLHGSILRG